MGISVSMRGGDMNKKVYDPDGDGKFDTDEIETTGAKGVTPLASFNPHGIGVHTDRLLSLNVPCWGGLCTGTPNYEGCLIDAAGEFARGYFVVPKGYVSTPKVYLVWKRQGAVGTFVLNCYSYAGAHDEPYNTHTHTVANKTFTVSAVNDNGVEDTTLDLSSISEYDHVELRVIGDATLTQAGYVRGFVFEYLGDE